MKRIICTEQFTRVNERIAIHEYICKDNSFDISFLMKDTIDTEKDTITTEVVGFLYGDVGIDDFHRFLESEYYTPLKMVNDNYWHDEIVEIYRKGY